MKGKLRKTKGVKSSTLLVMLAAMMLLLAACSSSDSFGEAATDSADEEFVGDLEQEAFEEEAMEDEEEAFEDDGDALEPTSADSELGSGGSSAVNQQRLRPAAKSFSPLMSRLK